MKSRSKVELTPAAEFIILTAASPRRKNEVSDKKITHRPMTVKLIPGIRRGQVQEHGDFVAVGKFDAIDAIGPDDGQQVFPEEKTLHF
jgi:hypothetical protein